MCQNSSKQSQQNSVTHIEVKWLLKGQDLVLGIDQWEFLYLSIFISLCYTKNIFAIIVFVDRYAACSGGAWRCWSYS